MHLTADATRTEVPVLLKIHHRLPRHPRTDWRTWRDLGLLRPELRSRAEAVVGPVLSP